MNDIFNACSRVNELLFADKSNEARNELIRVLDYHEKHDLPYSTLLNHLVRETGLYPYLQADSASWQDRFAYEAFKVDIGLKAPVTLHREQSTVLRKLLEGVNLAISAPTSFGKSFIIDAYISTKKPKNIVIIVPTIALTDETRRRLHRKFSDQYRIITTTDCELATKNIFIFPQERAIAYADSIKDLDLLVIDEFYKASPAFDKERSPALLRAMIKLGEVAKQRYFLAPNISDLNDNPFTNDMEFIKLDFNTVFLEKHDLISAIGKDEIKKTNIFIDILRNTNGKSLIYAGTYSNIDKLANVITDTFEVIDSKLLTAFEHWLSVNYSKTWHLPNLIKRGTGIHNGQLHRSLSQIQIKLFEANEGLKNIISTSSIIEGVNTSAENVIVWSNKNGRSLLNDFTYKNIIGRGGRMFRHFIGKIYILEPPPRAADTQLELSFPDQILGDIDEVKFKEDLTKEQIAKIILYKEEMSDILGEETFNRLQRENVFQCSDSSLLHKIAYDMKTNSSSWNGLVYLNSPDVEKWDRHLYKVIYLQPGGWETQFSKLVEFIKILSQNWQQSIPELLYQLDRFDIGVDQFFNLEKKVTYKLAALLNDVNVLQKEILGERATDISPFISKVSHAFLPPTVYQLEEYGLPRMISRKIHNSSSIKFTDPDLKLHDVLDTFNQIGLQGIISSVPNLHPFDKYILKYFFAGISLDKDSF